MIFVLLASRYVDIQNKTDVMAEISKGLDVNIEKTKVLRMNARTTQPVQLYGKNVEEFTYLGATWSRKARDRQQCRELAGYFQQWRDTA